MNGKTCGSTENLSKHLKIHMDKIDLLIKKQTNFIKKFLTKNPQKSQQKNMYSMNGISRNSRNNNFLCYFLFIGKCKGIYKQKY